MKVNLVSQFSFHSLNSRHPVKILSLITVIALSALSLGIYFILFLKEIFNKNVTKKDEIPLNNLSQVSEVSGFVGIKQLKRKQAEHLLKLQALGKQGQWEHLREHTWHPDSGFDWWMFPTDRSSHGQGDKYKLSQEEIKVLKADFEFMKNYRAGVKLVLFSWGWDVDLNSSFQNEKQRWTGYQVRLGKMVHSLFLFEEKELLHSIKEFCKTEKIILQAWIQQYLDKTI